MTTYELYINDILCDLSSDEVITLLYQSPIFSSLDSIQSNRSYNIALPPTPANMRAIGQAARPDVDADAPYVRLPAALYQDGVPLFTQGFAVVTDIADTINVTLTWGNADNFQPLFDANLRDLGPQLEAAGENIIAWNKNTAILEGSATGEYPGVAFWGVDFGMGISDPKYLHPSVLVSSILSAIERQNGVTIDGKERLAYSKNLGPIIPLTRKKVGPKANGYSNYCDISMSASDILPKEPWVNTRGIFSTSEPRIKLNDSGTSYITLYHPNSPTGDFLLPHNDANDISSLKISIYCDGVFLGEGESYEKTKTSDTMWMFKFHKISVQTDTQGVVTVKMSKPISGSMVPVPNPIISIHNSDWDIYFPGFFPVAPNLPDISQGDFIIALMSMNGLFAYADKDSPNTIKLISIDDIIANVQKNDIIDWSDRVILNDLHRVDMPDASMFTIDDLAQSNILDYDNDDDVKADTHGTITIRNENIEKETELVSLPFSASENATTDGVNCAAVPIYEDNGKGGANYSECSPRILSGRGAFMSGIARCIGVFDPWMKFGGDGGIVKTRYASYQKVVDRLRIITIRAKLTALDLYNLDYTKPVYIAQFGQIFAIYSVETGEDGICDCQLLKLKVDGVVPVHYDLLIGGNSSDFSIDAVAAGAEFAYSVETNGTPYIVSYDSRLTVSLNSEADTWELSIYVPENTSDAEINYDPVILGISEADHVRREISISQKGKEYYLTLNGAAGDIALDTASGGGILNIGCQTNGTAQISGYTEGVITNAYMNGISAIRIIVSANKSNQQRTGQVTVYLKEAPSIERKIVVIQDAAAAERMVIIDMHACGVEAGENIELMFELTTSWLGWFDVLDDLTVRVSFNELSSMMGQELADHVGERFYIEASNNGECWFGPIPASGNIEAELV